MILIPVKDLNYAKQRLASVLDQSSRTELAKAMLTDILETLDSWACRPAIGLVTNDRFAIELAQRFKYEVIPDIAGVSETDAIDFATRACERRGVSFTLVLPADIPMLTSAELDKVFADAPEEGSVLVPSADKRGTNAVYRSPPGLFPLRFGNDSFVPHLETAKATGKACVVLSLPGIGLDIDTASDLSQLSATPGQTRSQKLARQWDFKSVPLDANRAFQ